MDAITGLLAKALGPRKIRVNPGMVETEGTNSAVFIGSDVERLVAHTHLAASVSPATSPTPCLRGLR